MVCAEKGGKRMNENQLREILSKIWTRDWSADDGFDEIWNAETERLKSKIICPGCGTLNPVNCASNDGFSCACGWETDALPSVGEIASSNSLKIYAGVNLSAFLHALFEQETTNDQN